MMSDSPEPPAQPPAAEAPSRLPNTLVRQLKARAQKLEPVLKVGHAGLSDAFLRSLEEALVQHELVKVKFTDLKDRKDELSARMAAATSSHLVWRIGHTAVLFRRRPSTVDTMASQSGGSV